MWFIEVLVAAAIAVVISVIFAVFIKNTGPWRSFWAFFLIIFLGVLAASTWIRPVGPELYGYYWLPGLFAGVTLAILLAAGGIAGTSDPAENRVDEYHKSQYENDKPGYNPRDADPKRSYFQGDTRGSVLTGAFFWVLILLLLLAAVTGMLS